MIAFTVPGPVRGKGRPRATARGGFTRMYTDAKTKAYESMVEFYARQAMGSRKPIEGPIALEIKCRMAVPPSYSKKRRTAILNGSDPYYGPFDADNYAKSAGDGMNGVCFLDDRQIMSLSVVKVPAEVPGLDIRITPYGP